MKSNRLSIIIIACAVTAVFLLCVPNAAQAKDPHMATVLQGLLQKYSLCIQEGYETRLPSQAVGPLRDEATCVSGKKCTRASRKAMYQTLVEKADAGDATGFRIGHGRRDPQRLL